jgi:hypothetical protein
VSLLDSLLEADLVTPPLANGTPFFQRERRETAPKENWRHKPRKCYLLCYDPNTSLQVGNLDVQSIAGDGISILGGATSTPTGSISSGGFVTAFTYQAVPEPSTWALATLGLVAILKGRKHVASR